MPPLYLRKGSFFVQKMGSTTALPGALAYFLDGELYLSTRHYFRSKDYDGISTALQQELLVEEDNLQVIKQSLHRLEEEMFKRLWKLKRTGEAL